MKLSSKTIQILKNFASINQGAIIRPGCLLKTTSNIRHVFAEAEIPDTFEKEFCIYDINDFLSVLSLLKEPELIFFNSYVDMTSDNNSVRYYYSNPSVVVAPVDKSIVFPEVDVSFILTADDLSRIVKAASILKVNTIEFNQDGITLANTNTVGNNFIIKKEMESSKDKFKFSIMTEYLKLIGDIDYKASISEKGIVRFESEAFGIKYYISLNLN